MAIGNDNTSLRGSEANHLAIIPDSSQAMAKEVYTDTSTIGSGVGGNNSHLPDASKGEAGFGIGEMFRQADSVVDQIPDDIEAARDSAMRLDHSVDHTRVSGKNGETDAELGKNSRAWSPKEVDLANASDPFAKDGKNSMAMNAMVGVLGSGDGRAYGINPDAIRQEANRIADERVLDQKYS